VTQGVSLGVAVEETRRLIIIGSGVSGLTAAVYAARGNLKPLVIEGHEPGGQLTLTSVIENFPGFPEGINGFELIQNMKTQAERFGAEYYMARVEEMDLTNRPFSIRLDDGNTLYAHAIIIASGARARLLGIPNEKEMIGHGVSTCAVCDGAMFRGRKVVVVGGGDSALEDALFLTKFASEVHLVHRRDQLRASKIMQERAMSKPEIHFHWYREVVALEGTPQEGLTAVTLRDTSSGRTERFACDGLFLAIGHIPNTDMLHGALPTNPEGYLQTVGGTRTIIPGVFAAGDVADPIYQQAITAAGTGCQAALEAEEYLTEHGLA